MYGYDTYGYSDYGYSSYGVSSLSRLGDTMIAVTIISAVIALVMAIYFLSRRRYEESSNRPGLHGLFRFFNFDMYVFSTIMKFLYMFATVYTIIMSFVAMFQDDGFLTGLLMLVIGPAVVRLIYELIYILFAIRDHLASAHRTLLDIKHSTAGYESARPARSAYAEPPRYAPQPEPRRFCPKCGREVKSGAPFCSNCGTRM